MYCYIKNICIYTHVYVYVNTCMWLASNTLEWGAFGSSDEMLYSLQCTCISNDSFVVELSDTITIYVKPTYGLELTCRFKGHTIMLTLNRRYWEMTL